MGWPDLGHRTGLLHKFLALVKRLARSVAYAAGF